MKRERDGDHGRANHAVERGKEQCRVVEGERERDGKRERENEKNSPNRAEISQIIEIFIKCVNRCEYNT